METRHVDYFYLCPPYPLFTSVSPHRRFPSSYRAVFPKPCQLLTATALVSFPYIRCLPLTARPGRPQRRRGSRDLSVGADDGDIDSGGGDDYDMDVEEDELEEMDNKDYDVEYDRLFGVPVLQGDASSGDASSGDDIEMVPSVSFVSTQGTDSETAVDYRINEDEFHKISLLHCDFFIRKPPDPDNNVYDFREMYATPPDTDVYSIPKVVAPMPRKVALPEGKERDRRKDLLIIRDGGTSFKIIDKSKRDDATTVIEREEWIESRRAMEKHLSKLRDYHVSNWF